MNILVDLRALQSGNTTGVEVFAYHLTKNLCQLFPQDRFFLWTNSKKPLPENFPEFLFPNATRLHSSISNKFLLLSNYIFQRPRLDLLLTKLARKKNVIGQQEQFDCFLVLDPRPTPLSKNMPKVTVVHDLSPLHFPKYFSLKTRLWQHCTNFYREMRTSVHILTPSRFTKEDVKAVANLSHERISVVGAAASEYLRPITDPLELVRVREKYGLPDQFFLTLSTLEPRKNLSNLVDAFVRFWQKHKDEDIALVIAGKQNAEIFQALRLPKHPRVFFPGFIAESDKAAVFSAAKAFLYPSLFEGFGIPVLEAMTCGIPVLCSHAAALPEVYGDAALSFDPRSPGEVTEALENFWHNHKLQKELVEKSLARSKLIEFSWETVAKKTMAVLKEVGEKRVGSS